MWCPIEQEPEKIIESGTGGKQDSRTGPGHAILGCLRIVVVLQCVGVAGRYLFSVNESESNIFGFLFFDIGWPEKLAQGIDDTGAYGCVISGAFLVVAGVFSIGRGDGVRRGRLRVAQWLDFVALTYVTTWMFLLAVAQMLRGEMYAELAIGEQAVRFTTPFAMLLLLHSFGERAGGLARIAGIILLLATAVTFGSHGYVATQLHGPFVDLILLTDLRLTKFGLGQSSAEILLGIIGWADIVVAALLLLTRWRPIAVYMAIWGLISAASRMTAFGLVAWPETLIRVANAGAPFALLLIYTDSWFNSGRTENRKHLANGADE